MTYDQICIGLFGVTAVFLSQSALAGRRRWACIFGMLGQPFWIIAAWKAAQWGIFGLSFLYTWAWCKGFYTHWIAPSWPAWRLRLFLAEPGQFFAVWREHQRLCKRGHRYNCREFNACPLCAKPYNVLPERVTRLFKNKC